MTAYYLAGPMAQYPEHNHPAFHSAAATLRTRGLTIINPAEFGNLITGWDECMKRDVHALLWCAAVIVLPGWEKSRGASLECNLATDLGMPVYELDVILCDCIRIPLGSAHGDIEPPPGEAVWHTERCYAQRIPIHVQQIRDAYTAVHPRKACMEPGRDVVLSWPPDGGS